MKELTHERCSELLQALVSGDLDEHTTADVHGHLDGCDACRLELIAVQALAGPAVEPMSGMERDVLTQAVRAALATPAKATFAERFGRRFAPALGAVAFIAIAVLGSVMLSRGDDTDVPQTSSATQLEVEDDAGESATTGGSGGGSGQGSTEGSTTMEADAATSKGAPAGSTQDTGGGAVAPEPKAATLHAASQRMAFLVETESFAEHGLDLRSLVPQQLARRATTDFYAGADLAAQAPNDRVATQVRDCSDRTVNTSPHPLVPTSATYYPDEVLVISFVWLESSTTTLNYEIWGWRNGRCDHVSPIFRRGMVE